LQGHYGSRWRDGVVAARLRDVSTIVALLSVEQLFADMMIVSLLACSWCGNLRYAQYGHISQR
jgi:hypothetical protein